MDLPFGAKEYKSASSTLNECRLGAHSFVKKVEPNCGVDKAQIAALATCDWVRKKQNIIVNGATGVGKSYLACALANKACREGLTVHFDRASRLFQILSIARPDGRYGKLMTTVAAKNLFGLFTQCSMGIWLVIAREPRE
jgi:DNA replication protein DnaC